LKKLFIAASGVFAAVPGVVIFMKGLGTPPEYALIFGGVIEAFGTLAFLILLINKGTIKSFNRGRITKWAIALAIVCFMSLSTYVWLYKLCVIPHAANRYFYFPLRTTGELSRLVSDAGSRPGAIEVYGPATVYEVLGQISSFEFAITTVVLLLVYQTIFTSLTVAFGLLGFHLEDDL
jgi:hypothetical protein